MSDVAETAIKEPGRIILGTEKNIKETILGTEQNLEDIILGSEKQIAKVVETGLTDVTKVTNNFIDSTEAVIMDTTSKISGTLNLVLISAVAVLAGLIYATSQQGSENTALGQVASKVADKIPDK